VASALLLLTVILLVVVVVVVKVEGGASWPGHNAPSGQAA
jgi:hypothetical protein